MERNKVVHNYRTFENLKTIDYKNIHDWSGRVSINRENEIRSSKLLIERTKDTPLLDWLNSKGYGVVGFEGLNREGSLDYLGQSGIPYTFYLIESWDRDSYVKYIEDHEGIGEDDLYKVFDLFDMDLDNLDIYGSSKSSKYEIKVDGSYIDIYQILDHYDENWNNLKKEIRISDEEIDYSRSGIFPFWASKVPLRFNSPPPSDSHAHRILCEIGLKCAQSEILKFIKIFKLNNYSDLIRRGSLDSNINRSDINHIIHFMNLSDVHMTKNEDLELAYNVYHNMYLGSKLFHENHENVKYELDPRLVDEFIFIKS